MSSSGESPKLAPEQELSAPPPDDIKPEAPKVEAPRIEPKVELKSKPRLRRSRPRMSPRLRLEAPKVEAPDDPRLRLKLRKWTRREKPARS